MAAQSALEQLWPELQRQILLHIDSLDSLHCFIHASPRLYHVFRANKEYILSNFVRRQFDHTVVRDALIIYELSLFEEPPLSRAIVLNFFDRREGQRSSPQVSVLPLPVSIFLCRLEATLQFFTNDYCRHTLPILAQLKNSTDFPIETHYPVSENDSQRLSYHESGRLRRAFCRFEIFRHLFARCSSNRDHDRLSNQPCLKEPSLSVFEQGKMFFQKVPLHQVAEIACVRDYLCRRLRGMIDVVEDQIVETLKSGYPSPESRDLAMDWDKNNGGRYSYFLYDEMQLLGHLAKPHQMEHIEYLLSLGLPYIQKILEADGYVREDLLIRNKIHCRAKHESQFLTAALGLDFDDFSPLSSVRGWGARKMKSSLDSTTQFDIPSGWLWAHADGYYNGLVDDTWKGLRDWGYVFWDLDRLREAEILSRNPLDVSYVSFNEFEAGDKPSIEERWIGVPHYSDQSETGETESFEDEEYEEGQEEIPAGGEEDVESPETARKPSSFMSKMRKWLRHAIRPILKVSSTLNRYGRRLIAKIAACF